LNEKADCLLLILNFDVQICQLTHPTIKPNGFGAPTDKEILPVRGPALAASALPFEASKFASASVMMSGRLAKFSH